MAEAKRSGKTKKASSREAPSVLLFIETSREFGRGLLYGIARYSRLHGPWRFHRRSAGLDSELPEWWELKIDGAIVRDVKMAGMLMAGGFPVIFAQHNRESYAPFPAIITDSAAIGKMAAEHFLNRGFKHFAYCGLDEFVWSRERGRCFVEHIAKSRYETSVYQSLAAVTGRTWKSKQNVIAEWLMSLPKPVALMCCNDDRALQVLEACKVANLFVPDEVAILGVDNDALICDLADPPISSVALDTDMAGYAAARLLSQLMNGEKMTGQEIPVRPTHIVTRMSSDLLAMTDSDVAAAVRFIRLSPDRMIQVDDVVAATSVSRRVLEKRFKSILRRSVYQEIRRVRVNHIIQLLTGSNLRITEIAVKAGFDGVEHISRYFRKQTGMSLREYRKQHAPK